MKYQELEEALLRLDKYDKDLERANRGNSESSHEEAGFISGFAYELYENIKYSLVDSEENFKSVMKFLRLHCPNSYNLVKDKLNRNISKYETLYDVCIEINIRREDNIDFPTDCLTRIKIYDLGDN